MSHPPVLLLGAGGHAKVVISALQALDRPILAALDDNQERWGTEILGVPVEGPMERVLELPDVLAVIAIGDNAVRRRLAERFSQVRWTSVVHPRAYVHPSVRLGAGSVLFAGAIIQPDVVIGEHAIINTGATVDHDCRLGAYVHVGPGAHLAGGVDVRDGVLLGVGSSIIPGRFIGEWTTVGAGGTVIHDLPAHVTATGVPAKPRCPMKLD